MESILVSSCLLGRPVRYDGRGKAVHDELFAQWRTEGRLVPFCPEVSGGLPVPRPPAEIVGDAAAVLDGTAQVRTAAGEDVTEHFVRGARLALEAAERAGARIALLKQGSPSCGNGRVHDGTFAGVSVAGDGVTTVLLERNGVSVFSEDDLLAVQSLLKELEK
ncbi:MULTISPECIES: DUF523 domain-containing protein [Thermomonosporaceae]|uniref:DUF523 domain-containing protein n=1 Tax=Thermomonosporaceae TaxID=2012 RepID=UPI00255AF8CB|nr:MULTISPECIES: DUF523 domain-containing protein [Thermomonosporaceae]MDL4775193.1 DUF523 domain-containing protein [Actinomadura xylanilytica]